MDPVSIPVSIQAGCRKDVNEIKGRVEHQSKNSLSNMLGEEKVTENICKFQIAFSQWIAGLIKKIFWDVLLRLASSVFMKNFRFISPAIHVFWEKMPSFYHICGENIFPAKCLRFYTNQKKNYQIRVKIEQKLGIYFSKLGNPLFQWIAP